MKEKQEGKKGYDISPSFSTLGDFAFLSMEHDGYEADKNDIIVRRGDLEVNLTKNWDGLVYENWREEKFDLNLIRNLESAFGLDFGYTNDPTALFCGAIDLKNKKIYVFDELYEKGLSNKSIYEKINEMGYSKERITADSSEPFFSFCRFNLSNQQTSPL